MRSPAGAPPAGRRGPVTLGALTGRVAVRAAALPQWATVLAWVAALAAIEPIVHGYLTNPPDQRLVDLNVYRTGGLSVLRSQPLYSVLTQPPQLLPFTYPPVAAVFAVPPVAWIHYFLMVIIAIGVVVGDGRRPRRVLTAAGTAVFFGLTIPWWGHSLLSDPGVPRLLSRIVEDAFGIAAVVLIIIIIARMRKTAADRDQPGSGPGAGDAGDAGPAAAIPDAAPIGGYRAV